MVSWLERLQLKGAILFGCYGKTLKTAICAAPAEKEDYVKHQQEKRPCEEPIGKEDSVKHQPGKKTL